MSYNIILGSQSPRRQTVLKEAGLDFKIATKNVEEIYPDDLPLEEIPVYLAKLKAEPFKEELGENDLLITADTIVILGDLVLGKPKDENDAFEALKKLSGQPHQVITGVSLTTKNQQTSFSDETIVAFYELTEDQIRHYIQEYKPYDKAGSYAIQEWIGLVGINWIKGNYYNVLGLPVARLLQELKKMT